MRGVPGHPPGPPAGGHGHPGRPGGARPPPRHLRVVKPTSFTIDIEADLPDGTIDTSFNGFVNVSVQPGTVSDLNVRNVQLTNGVIHGVVVPTVAAFGEAHIWADDVGYTPKAPNENPECSDGLDNNGNGLIDYPADPGCYAPVDDTEDLGTYASGASETLYFALPRIPLVRGYDPTNNGNGNATSFPNTQVSIDTGWRGGTLRVQHRRHRAHVRRVLRAGPAERPVVAHRVHGRLRVQLLDAAVHARVRPPPAAERHGQRLLRLHGAQLPDVAARVLGPESAPMPRARAHGPRRLRPRERQPPVAGRGDPRPRRARGPGDGARRAALRSDAPCPRTRRARTRRAPA